MFLRRASEVLKRIRLNLPTVDRLKGSSVSLPIVLGVHSRPSLAEEASVADLANRNDGGEADVIGLQRIEDGSVASNEHTVKWRIFTDKGRELFLQGKLDNAETCFSSALREAREGFGERDPHVASSCNNLCKNTISNSLLPTLNPLTRSAVSPFLQAELYRVNVGAALHNLGQFYVVQRKLEEARVCYERALKNLVQIKGRVLGYAHLDYAETMYHLGKV
ncbi:hypothetical protein QJS10_CPA06g02090 [Acorus calamus]|uniref:Kinesin light chain n=1 Tax=Acorus calamus TaxID=4465 RepID=A0AAV9EHA7_ACOCL|nr:hypothetical protein QJS10_CPA06g02090 [Acorus calamus]